MMRLILNNFVNSTNLFLKLEKVGVCILTNPIHCAQKEKKIRKYSIHYWLHINIIRFIISN